MVKLLLFCPTCKRYLIDRSIIGIKEDLKSEFSLFCKICNSRLKTPHPPKFSLDNRYHNYIRQMKSIKQKE